jgi:hypothetical protein
MFHGTCRSHYTQREDFLIAKLAGDKKLGSRMFFPFDFVRAVAAIVLVPDAQAGCTVLFSLSSR